MRIPETGKRFVVEVMRDGVWTLWGKGYRSEIEALRNFASACLTKRQVLPEAEIAQSRIREVTP